MAFDIEKMVSYCRLQIDKFARDHSQETFYAFAIDASMLCLNSIERFDDTLREYQSRWDRRTRKIETMADLTAEDMRDEKFGLDLAEKYMGLNRTDNQACLAVINEYRSHLRSKGCEYRTDEGIRNLRDNTGDWAYQGFAALGEENGFDDELYTDHYYAAMESNDGHAPHTSYAVAMTELVDRLRNADTFKLLNLTNDFSVSWVDHDY